MVIFRNQRVWSFSGPNGYMPAVQPAGLRIDLLSSPGSNRPRYLYHNSIIDVIFPEPWLVGYVCIVSPAKYAAANVGDPPDVELAGAASTRE